MHLRFDYKKSCLSELLEMEYVRTTFTINDTDHPHIYVVQFVRKNSLQLLKTLIVRVLKTMVTGI